MDLHMGDMDLIFLLFTNETHESCLPLKKVCHVEIGNVSFMLEKGDFRVSKVLEINCKYEGHLSTRNENTRLPFFIFLEILFTPKL